MSASKFLKRRIRTYTIMCILVSILFIILFYNDYLTNFICLFCGFLFGVAVHAIRRDCDLYKLCLKEEQKEVKQ